MVLAPGPLQSEEILHVMNDCGRLIEGFSQIEHMHRLDPQMHAALAGVDAHTRPLTSSSTPDLS